MIRFTVVVSLVAMIAGAPVASAQPAATQADVLFRRGRDLMAAGKVGEACTAFAESEKLEPAVTTLLNLAGCREKNGQLASAWGLFLDAERQTRSASDAKNQQLHGIAQSHAEKLEPTLSTLTITVSEDNRVRALEIVRNGEVVDVGTFNRPLPIDGGTYTIFARAPGYAEVSMTVTVGVERDAKTIEIPKLAPAIPGAVAANRTEQRTHAPESSTQVPHKSDVVPLVLGAGALALLGGGLGFELWGSSTYNDAKAETTNQTRRDSLYGSANDKRYVAEGLVVAGVATAGLAVWLYVRDREDNRDDQRSMATASKSRLVVTPIGFAIVGGF